VLDCVAVCVDLCNGVYHFVLRKPAQSVPIQPPLVHERRRVCRNFFGRYGVPRCRARTNRADLGGLWIHMQWCVCRNFEFKSANILQCLVPVMLFLGLFACQTRFDFSGIGPYLTMAVLIVFLFGFMGGFYPFSGLLWVALVVLLLAVRLYYIIFVESSLTQTNSRTAGNLPFYT